MTVESEGPPNAALRAVRVPIGAELQAALAASGTGTWRWEAATGVVRWDATLEALSGLPPGGFASTFEAWMDTLHPDEVESILAQVDAAIEARSGYHFEHRTIWPDGTVRWLECRGQVTVDDDGTFTGTVGCAVDITERRHAELQRAEAFERERRLRDRLEFLARLTDTAGVATDHHDYMRRAATAAVPQLGDWCSIHFLPEPDAELELVVAHADPTRVAWADDLARRFPYDPSGGTGVPAVIRTGQLEFIERVTDEVIEEALARSEHDTTELRRIADELALTSMITVPLRTKRGVLGAMRFVTAESGRVYDADDVGLARMAAGRIADALDNAWLSEQHRRISATLQRALLPPSLPTIDGLDVAVRYWPAGAAVEAGGDFYDVFRIGPSSWSVLIGDVCGTGPDAAALTGIARHTTRAAARHGQCHRTVLEWLNEAMQLSNRDRFCTAIYATLDGGGDGWRFTTSTGGHPRPVLVRADGSVSLIGELGSLLGVFDDIRVSVADTMLDPGDVVVLYTDGISDLTPPHARTEDDVAALVAGLSSGRTSEEIAEAIHRSVVDPLPPDHRRDDVALVVLRVLAPPSG